jgi:acylphosphatase
VFFRDSVRREANRRGVSGWAKNCADGSVEAEVEGEPRAVEALIAWARRGPRGAAVTDVAVTWSEPIGERGRFAIRH